MSELERLWEEYDKLQAENNKLRQAIAESEINRIGEREMLYGIIENGVRLQMHPGAALFKLRWEAGKLQKPSIDPAVGEIIGGDIVTGMTICIKWSDAMGAAGLATMEKEFFELQWLVTLPSEVYAENWWHLCSQTGLLERYARAFYFHPEEGQPSAVSMLDQPLKAEILEDEE